jgi:hypothetical protein
MLVTVRAQRLQRMRCRVALKVGVALLTASCLIGAATACGGGSGTTAGAAGATTPTSAPTTTEPSDPGCADQIGDFVEQLQELDSRLDIGLNFESYSTKVSDAKVVYDQIPFDEMSQECVRQVGVPAENAFNAYVKAYNIWNNCFDDINCDNDSIKSKLQAQWAKATLLISKADGNLQALSG